MQKPSLLRDSILATVSVFLVMGLFAYFPFNTHILDPLKHGLADFEFSDIYFSRIKKNPGVDTNIFVVNIGYSDRYSLTEQIHKIEEQKPKVLALDFTLTTNKNPFIDSALADEINKNENIVMASYLKNPSEHGKEFESMDTTALPVKGKEYGFINFFMHDTAGLESVRKFKPRENAKGKTQLSFPAAIVKKYNPEAYQTLYDRGEELQIINYSRRMEEYHVLEAAEVLDTAADLSYLKDKIVIMGFMGPDVNTKVLEDNFFTPLNPKFSGKTHPDMYGALIHANIVSMALERSYINQVPGWLSLLVAFVICLLHIVFFIKFYVKHHMFYHLISKIVQLLTFAIMLYVSFWLLSAFGLKMNMSPVLGAIALSVDVLYFYDGFVTWLHKKFGYKTVFGHH